LLLSTRVRLPALTSVRLYCKQVHGF
jgi:hypothetical protein